MKIVNPGKTKPVEKEKPIIGYKVTCAKCDCTFVINKNEMEPELIQGGFTEYKWNCPWCGAEHCTWYGVNIKKMTDIRK